jgi:hypothetical protein
VPTAEVIADQNSSPPLTTRLAFAENISILFSLSRYVCLKIAEHLVHEQ